MRISQNSLGWKGPAVDRVTVHLTKLLKALSSLAFEHFRIGVSTTSLDNQFQCLTTLPVKNFFLYKLFGKPEVFTAEQIVSKTHQHLLASWKPSYFVHVPLCQSLCCSQSRTTAYGASWKELFVILGLFVAFYYFHLFLMTSQNYLNFVALNITESHKHQ